ncbi:AAA family ATPase [bacterium]|nr:AAA family ATPase [bacterium]
MIIFRQLEKSLESWRSSTPRRPLLLRGARQVGKSHLVRTWGARSFGADHVIELNLEEFENYRIIFEKDSDVSRIASELRFLFGRDVVEPNTLLFIDEIQACPKAITTLRYFFERMPEIPVIAAGSLIDFVLEETGFPVGRVDTLVVPPLSFFEFLAAGEKAHYIDVMKNFSPLSDQTLHIPEQAHSELLLELKKYFRIGGMPEAVASFSANRDYHAVSRVHARLVNAYFDDFSKYSKKADWDLLLRVFTQAPHIVGNTKVQYTHFDRETRSYKIKRALSLLFRANLLTPIYHSSAKLPPLQLGTKKEVFKLLFLDIGLMQHMLGFDWGSVAVDDPLSEIANGRLAEQFVGQEFLAKDSRETFGELYYYVRQKKGSDVEVDYLREISKTIIPIEVKSGHRGTLKSLTWYLENHRSQHGLILSQRNITVQDELTWLPLYLAAVL